MLNENRGETLNVRYYSIESYGLQTGKMKDNKKNKRGAAWT